MWLKRASEPFKSHMVFQEASAKAARRALQAGRPSSSAAPPESSAEEEITGAFTAEGVAGSTESPRRVSCRMIQMMSRSAACSETKLRRGSEQPKTPPKGSRPPPKLPSDSAAWKPSLRGGETADCSESAKRPSKPKPEAGRKVARADPAPKEAGQPLRRSALPLSTEAGGTRETG